MVTTVVVGRFGRPCAASRWRALKFDVYPRVDSLKRIR